MRIAIITRTNHSTWGGDLKALQAIREGLHILGHEVLMISTLDCTVKKCDFVLITNTCLDQRDNYRWLTVNRLPYGAICFHEDFDRYLSHCMGFSNYIKSSLRFPSEKILEECIAKLYTNPDLVRWYTRIHWDASVNYQSLKDARFCIANSHMESETILRDCPEAKVKVVYWTPGMVDEWDDIESQEFLDLTGLQKNEYVLQVGRLEPRKNQFASLIACRDFDTPLVFIATKGDHDDYENAFINLATRLRHKKTVLVTNKMESRQIGSLKVVQMPLGQKLSANCLKSAYQNAKLHVHPAYYELPGYTYLESVKYNIPTLASSWTSISEYFRLGGQDANLNGMVEYTLPYRLDSIKSKAEKLMKANPVKLDLQIYKRTKLDVAKEILRAIEGCT